MMNFIRNLIKRSALKTNPIDSGDFQIGQVSYLGAITNAEIFHIYGFGSRPPIGSYCVNFSVQGQAEHQVCLAGTPAKRIKNLNPGETYFANLESGTNILNAENGDMKITVNNDYISVIKNDTTITVSKNMDITVSGNITINCSGSTKINCDSIDLGESGSAIARLGDSVQVDTGTGTGTITSASTKNRSA